MSKKNTVYAIFLLAVGILLVSLAFLGKADDFWNGLGSALTVVGAIRLLRGYRLQKSEAYREKMEVETTDERLQFLRGKAWAWAGYLFVLIVGAGVILLKILGQDLLSLAASYGVCLLLILYWVTYLILKRKY